MVTEKCSLELARRQSLVILVKNLSVNHKSRSHILIRSKEDGEVEVIMRQFLGNFALKEKSEIC